MTPEQLAIRAEKARIRSAAWYQKNKERVLEYDRQRRLADPTRNQKRYQKFKEDNPDYWKNWYANNTERHLVRTRQRHREMYVPRPLASHQRELARSEGLRSGWERTLSIQLKNAGTDFGYEVEKIPYTINHKYCPDFTLGNGIRIEAKGYFRPGETAKYKAVKAHHPDLDLRFVFMNADLKISGLKSTHAAWCDRNGFKWASGSIPIEWLSE